MLTQLHLKGFKSFEDATLTLGPLTVLIGTNASGKSNIRDAFRFLHGISRGYSLAEIIGEKWGEGGVLQWRGIRGGAREVLFPGSRAFTLEVKFRVEKRRGVYGIKVDPGENGTVPRVEREWLYSSNDLVYDTHWKSRPPTQPENIQQRKAAVKKRGKGPTPHFTFLSDRPLLVQLPENKKIQEGTKQRCRQAREALASMRFLDLNPDAMRMPSLPGQTVLGDRGENLSSVLHAICTDERLKKTLALWVSELTPMDAVDFKFVPDPTGRILVFLVERDGREISAHSASDGTLRFLAMAAALLGPEPARFYFFEELDNGVHPSRLHLLLELIERRVNEGDMQVTSTTHSPFLLQLLSKDAREHASLTYRREGSGATDIVRLMDLPNASRLAEDQELARLHAAGWFEDAVVLADAEEAIE
ncbi:MAG: ATP-binding protein [Acidobacteria bacterium]|nr:ATP-binding protein [Acidobacteriota bacterium]